MTRLAAGRSTHLSAAEIAKALLHLYDTADREPSLRALAAELGSSPRAIYHYYGTRADLIEAAMELVWSEIAAEIAETVADPVSDVGDPVEFLVTAGVATRRVFGRHRRLATHLGMTATPTPELSGSLAIMGATFEQLGLTGSRAGLATYAYLTYVLGAIVLEASRWSLEGDGQRPVAPDGFTTEELRPDDAPLVRSETAEAIDAAITRDRGTDEEQLFVDALRELIRGFVSAT